MPAVESLPEKEADEPEPHAAVSTDLRSDGTFGPTWLHISDHSVRVVESDDPEQSPPYIEVPLSAISDPRVEELVDSSALVVTHNGAKLELVRGSNRCQNTLYSAQRKLDALLVGDGKAVAIEPPRVCPKCGRPLPQDSDKCDACVRRGRTLLRVFAYLRPYKRLVVLASGLMLVAAGVELLPPYLSKVLIDQVLTAPRAHANWFVPIILALVVARIIAAGTMVLRGRTTAKIGHSAIYDLRAELYRHLQKLSMSYFDKRQVGSIVNRVAFDTQALLDLLVDAVPALVANSVLIILIACALFVMNWHVALLTLLPAPVIFALVRIFRRRILRAWRHFWHRRSLLAGALTGVLSGTKVVKAFAGEDVEQHRFERRVGELREFGMRAERMWVSLVPMIQFLIHGSAFLVWFFAGRQVMREQMTVGELVAFLGYLALFYGPLQQLTRFIDWASRSMSAAERIFEVMDTQPEIHDAPDAVPMPDVQGAVKLENVHFGYDKHRMVLKSIDVDVKAGEMIGLVGPSGAGKTTVTNLLCRFYDPVEGRVLVDGVDMRKMRVEDIRRHTALVLQDTFLFPSSIRDNIAYGRPGATDEEIMNAAKAANAHDFVMRFPDGYDTYVGERGQRLSGGERQRIAIARAILRDPRILILDEATSSVDSEAEAAIQEAVGRLITGRTTFVIAHRLSTLRHADRIVVMEEGEIVQMGTHLELMQEPGVYRNLVERQQELNLIRGV
jgi:ATP-binding cassette subfamily B protein